MQVAERAMAEYSKRNRIYYVESPLLREHDCVVHAFCSRCGGVSSGRFSDFNFSVREGDSTEAVRENWAMLSRAFAIPVDRFYTVNQVHEDRVLAIGDDHVPEAGEAQRGYDAIITNRRGLAVGVKTADCVPILVFDSVQHVVGVVHAGWKGTSLQVAAKAIDVLIRQFDSRAENLVVAIGPAIGSCCYEVDAVVYEAMRASSEWQVCARRSHRAGRWMLDLSKVNKLQMIARGVPPENISSFRICTSCHTDMFYSHRGEEGHTGRQLSFIMLQGGGRE